MKVKNSRFLLLLFSIGWFSVSYSQTPIQQKTQDTVKVYKKIEDFSKKSKLTKTLHKFIFEPTDVKNSNPIRRKAKPKQYRKFEGKIIRNINIETLDPFGYSVSDTTQKPDNWGEKVGNIIHIKSKKFAIQNILLFKKNQPLDTVIVRETERLIRNERFVRRVEITGSFVKNSKDSVDVTIRVLDTWSLIPKGSISSSRMNIELNERNFLGSGHEFSNKLTQRFEDGKAGYRMRYVVPNIMNTFVKTTILYDYDLDDNYQKSINIERTFISPFTKWAGGIYLEEQFSRDSLPDQNLKYDMQNFKYNSQDFWAGRSFKIFEGNTELDRTSNLIVAGRFLNINFKERPTAQYDSINYYSNETFVMGNIGIASRQFVEDSYIFNYGIIEDVPVGRIFGITVGNQHKNFEDRFYLGARASFGNYFKWGYLSTNFEYGTFFKDSNTEQNAFTFQANYFTNLIDLGENWKLRQFIKPQITIGNNRKPINDDYVSLNENTGFQGYYGAGTRSTNYAGISGFNSPLYGTKKFLLSTQTQFYSPWNLGGFRINPYVVCTSGIIADQTKNILKSKLYSSIGIGVIISNDYLVFNSFQFSIAYYPNIPNEGYHLFKTNSFHSDDFGMQNFDFGKPRQIIYN